MLPGCNDFIATAYFDLRHSTNHLYRRYTTCWQKKISTRQACWSWFVSYLLDLLTGKLDLARSSCLCRTPADTSNGSLVVSTGRSKLNFLDICTGSFYVNTWLSQLVDQFQRFKINSLSQQIWCMHLFLCYISFYIYIQCLQFLMTDSTSEKKKVLHRI